MAPRDTVKTSDVPPDSPSMEWSAVPEGARVLRWLNGFPSGAPRGAEWEDTDLGILPPSQAVQDRRRWCAECATVASWVEEGRSVDWVKAGLDEFRTVGVFKVLAEGKSVSKCLQQNEFFRGQPGLLRLVSGLLVAEAALHWIRKHPSFQQELLDSTDGLARFEMLHCGPLGSAYPVGAFWWARQFPG